MAHAARKRVWQRLTEAKAEFAVLTRPLQIFSENDARYSPARAGTWAWVRVWPEQSWASSPHPLWRLWP
uniref:Uncharacterized protein n=1 Tax=Leishmania guyanensis TaxID=5670 RepID=A0A1E1IRA8_LEIGU|nr:Hypothetical protein BN36_1112050 [Leishmania guyanensis]